MARNKIYREVYESQKKGGNNHEWEIRKMRREPPLCQNGQNALWGDVAGTYRLSLSCVLVTIVISALANVAGPLFLMVLIDDFITPLLGQQRPDFTVLNHVMAGLAAFYVAGVICTYTYNRLMINIGQGVQKRIRDEMFEHMQTLPVRYFDRHPHGELMSRYTNDIDTLRQMINQALPWYCPPLSPS